MNCGSASVMRLMRQCFPFLSFLHSVFLSFFSSSFSLPLSFHQSVFPLSCLPPPPPYFCLSFIPVFPPSWSPTFLLSIFKDNFSLQSSSFSVIFLVLSFPNCSFPSFLSFPVSLLVVCGAALPLPGVVHARCANGAGDEVSGARGHEVSHCRRDVHPLVCH